MIKKSEDPGIFPTKISEGFGRGVPGSVVQAKASQLVQSGGADRITNDIYHVVNGDPEAIETFAQYYPNWSHRNFVDFLAALEGEPAMEENRITDARTRRLAGLPALRENDEDLKTCPHCGGTGIEPPPEEADIFPPEEPSEEDAWKIASIEDEESGRHELGEPRF
jgi:hypothetical protein